MKTIDKEILADSMLGHEFAKRECFLHAKICHPNIIQVLDVCETPKCYVLFMEYAGYGSNYFARKIHSHQSICNTDKLRKWASQILSALKFLHETCRIIHQDLKPENILMTDS